MSIKTERLQRDIAKGQKTIEEHDGAHLIQKSGVKVAKLPKTDIRYWQKSIFLPPGCATWAARVQFKGRRETFGLATPNKAAAAAKARDIFTALVGGGWVAALERFKPDMQRPNLANVGALIAELREHWSGKARTFEDYARAFRCIVAGVFRIEGGDEKHDYRAGGRASWVEGIDTVKLDTITPALINKWRIGYVKRAGTDPVKQKHARISCNSIIRQARSLFSKELLAHLRLALPPVMPFAGVAFYPRESMRYKSAVDIEELIGQAVSELPVEQLKCFLLSAMAGLRKSEADMLPWTAFKWNEGCIRIENTAHFEAKTATSCGDIPVDPEMLALFRGWHAQPERGEFVIESAGQPGIGKGYQSYRCEKTFKALLAWLRAHGVSAAKPLHELRKEFGSLLCQRHGIYIASRMLRHADVAITAAHYTDTKERCTVGLGAALADAGKVIAIGTKAAA